LLVSREDNSGEADTSLLQASNAGIFISDPSLTFAPEIYQPNVASGTLSPRTPLVGAVPATFTFSVNAAGVSSGTPKWYDMLEACGFEKVDLYRVSTAGATPGTAVSGVFQHGETVTGGTSMATATVFFDTVDGSTDLYVFEPSAALTQGEAFTGGTSGATIDGGIGTGAVDISAVAAHGFRPTSLSRSSASIDGVMNGDPAVGEIFVGDGGTVILIQDVTGSAPATAIEFRFIGGPSSISDGDSFTEAGSTSTFDIMGTPSQIAIPTLSMALAEDGRIKVGKGFRGNVVFSGSLGEPMQLQFSFNGTFYEMQDGIGFSNASFNELTAPTLLGVSSKVGSNEGGGYDSVSTEVTVCINSINANIGHNVAFRRCMSEASGIVEGLITQRQPTLTIDPEVAPEAFFPFITDMTESQPFRFTADWGQADGNNFRLQCPAAIITGETPGDRDGIGVSEWNTSLASTSPDGSERTESEILFALFLAPTTL